jgi:hypothetical protein|tara:strand:+ start:77 stop:769 length:693 start_codon:yes stop_codon:yes gene_type:complete
MMPLDNINDVLLAATFDSDGSGNVLNITFPVSGLPKFNSGNDVQEGAELVYALLDRLQTVVSAGGHSSLGASVNNTFNASALTMNRNFSFNSTLDVSDLSNFDVKPDTSFNAIPTIVFTLADDSIEVNRTDVDTTAGVTLGTLTFTGDGVAIGNVATYAFAISTSDGGQNDGSMVVEYASGGWKLRSNGGAFVNESPAKNYTITVTTDDADDVNPIPAVTEAFSLVVADA